MRKMMTKEVTKTIVKLAKMEIVNGVPSVSTLEDKVFLGNVDSEKAQKLVTKEFGHGVSVLNVQAETVVYELPVEEFIKIATIKVEQIGESVQA